MLEDIDARRHVALEGSPNFRDFGGYPTQDGRQVAWGKLYRSGSLNRLSDADLDLLAKLNIATICDFRHDEECAREPSRWPSLPDARRVRLSLEKGDHAAALKQLLSEPQTLQAERIASFMVDVNRDFALRQTAVYGDLMRQVLESSGPVLIHCTAGKDRTGFGAAVILSALGVDEADIMRDYLLTGHFLNIEQEIDRMLLRYRLNVPRDIGLAIFGVVPEYLRGALDAVATEYGDFASYLRDGLGLDDSALRELRDRLLI